MEGHRLGIVGKGIGSKGGRQLWAIADSVAREKVITTRATGSGDEGEDGAGWRRGVCVGCKVAV